MKTIKSLDEPCLLRKGISEIIKNEAKEAKRRILFCTLGTSSLGNLLTGKDTIRTDKDF